MTSINKRVIKDIREGTENLKKEFGIYIAPEDENIYRVHFVLPGPEDTPFEGGLYHGMIRLNDDHPRCAPNIHMITPSGRFNPEPHPIPNTSRGICTTATAFHPESWTPLNNIETVLKGFISLMCDPSDIGTGGMRSTPEQIKKFAKASIDHLKNDIVIKNLFPDLYEKIINGTYVTIKLADLSKNNKSSELINTKNIKDVNIKKIVSNGDFSDNEDNLKKSTNKTDVFDDENNIIVVSNKNKNKNKKIIIENLDSDSDSDFEGDILNVTDSEDNIKKSNKKINDKSNNKSSKKHNKSKSKNSSKNNKKQIIETSSDSLSESSDDDVKTKTKSKNSSKNNKKQIIETSSDSSESSSDSSESFNESSDDDVKTKSKSKNSSKKNKTKSIKKQITKRK